MRTYTVAEANALVPRVREIVPRLREHVEKFRFHEEQVRDMENLYGLRVNEPDLPEAEEYRTHRDGARAAREAAEAAIAQINALGAEVKDPLLGLVDWRAEREDGEIVYLCWRDGESEIHAWHPLEGGFASRRPIDTL